MTAKEKFLELVSKEKSNTLEKIRNRRQEKMDEYAIEFAEWLYKWDNTRLPNGNWIIKLSLKPYTTKEVLEIFKKQKGL